MINALLNIPQHTNCTNCGKCCGVIPATRTEVKDIKAFMKKNGIKAAKHKDKSVCPFRDEQARKCLIYPVRPLICRLFGVVKKSGHGVSMCCPNGNSAAIDGSVMVDSLINREEGIEILNFINWD